MTLRGNILREYYSRSFYNFFRTLWGQVETDEFTDNYHIKLICNNLQKRFEYWINHGKNKIIDNELYDLLINCPPGASKSLIISVFFPSWCWLIDPKVKFISCSYSHKIAEELSGKSLRLMQSDLYKEVITFIFTSTAVNNLKNNKGGQRFVTSVGGAITGFHADIILCDDVNSPQSIHSAPDREQARKFVNEILPSRKTNPKRSFTVYVQQRLHNDDASGILLKQKRRFKHIIIPAIDTNGESFFPNRFTIDFLNTIKAELGSISFNAQYMQVTQDEQGGIIKRQWIKESYVEDKTLIFFLDSAYGGKNADDNAIIGCYKESNNLIIHTLEVNKLEFPELINWLKINLPHNAKLYIEGKASGKSIIQTLKQQTTFNIIETQPKGSKLERKHSSSPYFESGRVIINQYINFKDKLIEQLIFDDLKNDDIQDVVCMAIDNMLKIKTGTYNLR